jgi:hypothetical protein
MPCKFSMHTLSYVPITTAVCSWRSATHYTTLHSGKKPNTLNLVYVTVTTLCGSLTATSHPFFCSFTFKIRHGLKNTVHRSLCIMASSASVICVLSIGLWMNMMRRRSTEDNRQWLQHTRVFSPCTRYFCECWKVKTWKRSEYLRLCL